MSHSTVAHHDPPPTDPAQPPTRQRARTTAEHSPASARSHSHTRPDGRPIRPLPASVKHSVSSPSRAFDAAASSESPSRPSSSSSAHSSPYVPRARSHTLGANVASVSPSPSRGTRTESRRPWHPFPSASPAHSPQRSSSSHSTLQQRGPGTGTSPLLTDGRRFASPLAGAAQFDCSTERGRKRASSRHRGASAYSELTPSAPLSGSSGSALQASGLVSSLYAALPSTSETQQQQQLSSMSAMERAPGFEPDVDDAAAEQAHFKSILRAFDAYLPFSVSSPAEVHSFCPKATSACLLTRPFPPRRTKAGAKRRKTQEPDLHPARAPDAAARPGLATASPARGERVQRACTAAFGQPRGQEPAGRDRRSDTAQCRHAQSDRAGGARYARRGVLLLLIPR